MTNLFLDCMPPEMLPVVSGMQKISPEAKSAAVLQWGASELVTPSTLLNKRRDK